MANEFKVKKGLIIDGSNTVLNVQGTQGQLFSVTDSLNGDLFSVSDISGIPILNVNSSGLVTIDGTITANGVTLTGAETDFVSKANGGTFSGALIADTNLDVNSTFKWAKNQASSYTYSAADGTGMYIERFSTAGANSALADMRFQARNNNSGTYNVIRVKGSDNTIRLTTPNTHISGALTVVGAIGASNFSGTHSGASTNTNTGDQTLPTDFVSKANGGTFGGNISASNLSGTNTGDQAPIIASDTFDYFEDSSAVSLHQFNNSMTEFNGNYNATSVGASFGAGVDSKFGTHGLNTQGDGVYVDIAGLPTIQAVSIWYKAIGNDNGYIVDFRHDAPGNGRGYLYTLAGSDQYINRTNDTTFSGNVGDIFINGVAFTGSSSYQFTSGSWYHIVITTNNTSTGQTWDQGIRIGNRSDGSSNGNAGYFDQVRTFNRRLVLAEVKALYSEVETGATADQTAAEILSLITPVSSTFLKSTTGSGTPGANTNTTISIGDVSNSYAYVQSHGSKPLNLNPSGNAVTIAGVNVMTTAGGTFTSPITVTGGGNTLHLKKGTGNPAIAFGGTSNEASFLIEGIAGGGGKFYTSTSTAGTIADPGWAAKLTIQQSGQATFTGNVNVASLNGGLKFNSANEAYLTGYLGGDGFTLPFAENTGYSNFSAGAFGVLFREARDSYVLGNAYFYKAAGAANGWRAKHGASGATMIGSDGGNFSFETAPASSSSPHALTFSTRMTVKQGGEVGVNGATNPFSKLQVGSQTFTGANGMHANSRVGISNHGSLTGMMLASTYNDPTYPEYGLVFIQGPSTGDYNVWSISPDGPARGGGLSFIFNTETTNIHTAAPKVYIQGTNGRVGIGNIYPESRLSISDYNVATYDAAAVLNNSITLGTSNGDAAGTSDTLGPGIVWKFNDGSGSYTKKSAGIMQVGEGNFVRSGLAFYTNNTADVGTDWSERMRLSMDGDFGIGTANPTAKLDVQGTQGQLFSVVDDLSGDLFSVADISGIPILNVEANGLVEISDDLKVSGPQAQIHNKGNDTTAKLVLSGHNNTGTPGVQTNATIEHRGEHLKTVITHNGADCITIGTGTNVALAGGLYTPAYVQGNQALIKSSNGHAIFGSNSASVPLGFARDSNHETYPDMTISTVGNMTVGGTVQYSGTGVKSINIKATQYPVLAFYAGADNTTNNLYTSIFSYYNQTGFFHSSSSSSWSFNNGAERVLISSDGIIKSKRSITWGASIGNSYVKVLQVSTDSSQLASIVRLSATAHGGSHVGCWTARLVVNHSQDITIKSDSGNYTLGTIKVQSNGNGEYHVLYKSNSATTSTYYFAADALTHTCSLTSNPTSTPSTTSILEHVLNFGSNYTQYDNNNAVNSKAAFGCEVKATGFVGTGGYHEFGNSTGSVSNDGSWNARLNVAGSSHARLDVKSVSDGIITTMYSHTGHAAGKVGTMSAHPVVLMTGGTTRGTVGTNGSLTMTGDVIAYSDKKLKENIKTLDGSKVLKMRGVSFTRKETGEDSSGVIAQEIQEVAPELVSETEGTLGVAYGNLVGYLIEAVKDQQKQIDELKKLIK